MNIPQRVVISSLGRLTTMLSDPDGVPLVQQFEDELSAVLERYCDQGLNTAEAIGTLELLKLEVYRLSLEGDEDDDEEIDGIA